MADATPNLSRDAKDRYARSKEGWQLTILVTGGTGFVGSHVLQLVAKNRNVVALTRSNARQSYLPRVKMLNVEQYLQNPSIAGPVEIALHMATIYDRNSVEAKESWFANYSLPLKIFLNHSSTLNHFVYLDSFVTAKLSPESGYLNSYIDTKQSFSAKLQSELSPRFTHVHISKVSLEHVYGPRDSGAKFIPSLAKKLLANEPIDLTTGLQKRDFVFVSDVANAIHLITQLTLASSLASQLKSSQDSKFEVGTGSSIQLRTLVEQMARQAKSESQLRFGVLPTPDYEIQDSYADTRALGELGWQPKISLEEGIARTLRFYRLSR